MSINKAFLERPRKTPRRGPSGGGADNWKPPQKGRDDARERLNELFQPAPFQESGMHADHDCHHSGLEDKVLAGRRVTCTGLVDGGDPAFSQDFP